MLRRHCRHNLLSNLLAWGIEKEKCFSGDGDPYRGHHLGTSLGITWTCRNEEKSKDVLKFSRDISMPIKRSAKERSPDKQESIFFTIGFGTLPGGANGLPDAGGSGCTTPPSSIDHVVQCYCATHLVSLGSGSSGPTTTVTGWSSTAPFGTLLTVTVNYTYSFWVIPNFIPGLASLRAMQATAVMKYE